MGFDRSESSECNAHGLMICAQCVSVDGNYIVYILYLSAVGELYDAGELYPKNKGAVLIRRGNFMVNWVGA